MASPGTIKPRPDIVKGLVTLFHIIAFLATFLRLLHRYQRRHFGWDDFAAGIAIIFAITTFLLFILRPIIFGEFARPLPTVDVSIPLQSFLVLGAVVFYMAGLWSAKVSMAITIVRLLVDGALKRLAGWAVLCYVVIGISLSTQRIFRCGPDFSKPAFCTTPKHIGYVELIFDLAGDTWLIGAPLYLLNKMDLDRQDHRLIASVFLCGIFTTIASILHDAFILADEVSMVGLTAHIQLAVSIIICNLPVLATYVYRKVIRSDSELESTQSAVDSNPDRQGHDDDIPMSVLTNAGSNVTMERPREEFYMEENTFPRDRSSRSFYSTADLGSILNSVRSTSTAKTGNLDSSGFLESTGLTEISTTSISNPTR